MSTQGTPKPDIHWLEGLLDYFNAPFPHESGDPRALGFGVGRQIIGLYLAEMLLKYAADNLNRPQIRTHSLSSLFRQLPRPRRRSVERKYSELLSSRVPQTFDFAKSVESLLNYLGEDPMAASRYFWERRHTTSDASIMFMPDVIYSLVHALFIDLHQYPQSGPFVKRYDTRFVAFEDTLNVRPL